jgi:hypothetical protein
MQNMNAFTSQNLQSLVQYLDDIAVRTRPPVCPCVCVSCRVLFLSRPVCSLIARMTASGGQRGVGQVQ